MARKSVLHVGMLSAVVATSLALSACGTTPGERAVSGGLLGAGAGAAVGSLSGHAGTGAVIGGVGGAAIGALTTPYPNRYGYYCVERSYYTGRCLRWG